MALDAIDEFLIKYGDGKQIANEDNDREFKCVSQEETLLVNLMTSPKDRVLIQVGDEKFFSTAFINRTLNVPYDYDSIEKIIDNKVKGLHFHLEVGSVLRTRKYNKWPDTDVKQWPIIYIEGLPQQTDTTSDGLFVLKYIEHWDGNRLVKKFNQAMIDSFRRKLVCILYNSSLNLVKPQT
ncbi:hypothetical protein EJB05_29092, partial [Eragrostis curvula]